MLESNDEILFFLKKQLKLYNYIFKSKDNYKLRSDVVIDIIKEDIENNNFDYNEIPEYIEIFKKYELYEVCNYLDTINK